MVEHEKTHFKSLWLRWFSPANQGQAQTQEDIQTPRNKHKLRYNVSIRVIAISSLGVCIKFVWSPGFRTVKNKQLILDTINIRSDIKLSIVQIVLG